MDPELDAIRREVLREIDGYLAQYTPPTATFGVPWSAEKIAPMLEEMRGALIEPHWIDVMIGDVLTPVSDLISRRCIAVADGGDGYLLAYDPTDREYLLAWRGEDAWADINVRGDAVGTFLSR